VSPSENVVHDLSVSPFVQNLNDSGASFSERKVFWKNMLQTSTFLKGKADAKSRKTEK
jgi:hypothetical protein